MNFLLDTHTFLWWALEPEKLSQKASSLMESKENRVIFSVVSSWEAQIKLGLGKLSLSEPLKLILQRELEQNGWEVLTVTLSHTWKLAELPPLHKDPFDRLLVAQAIAEDFAILSKDPMIAQYAGARCIW